MTVSEMERYFETTALSTPSERTSKFTKITLSNAITQQSCDLYYYDSSAIDSYHTDKKHIVILRSAEYENIKTSVRK